MTPAARRDALVERLTVLKSELFVLDVPDTPVSNWSLGALEFHVRHAERMVRRLAGKPEPAGEF